MPRIALIVAASFALFALFARDASAQLRTSSVLVRWYRQTRLPVPPSGEIPGSTLLGLDCRRSIVPHRGGTHCTIVPPAAADRRTGYVSSISECYGPPATRMPSPGASVANTVRAAFETSHSELDEINVTLPAGTAPVFVVVRWTDLGLGSHCIRWTRHCQGLDCQMSGAQRFCAASTMAPTQSTSVAWAWISGTTVHLLNEARFNRTEAMVVRFESASPGPGDNDADRANIGTLDATALRALAASTRDPVTRHAAWVNLAVQAWRDGRNDDLREAADHAAQTLAEALAVVPAAERSAFSAPAEQLAQRLGWRENASLEACGAAPAP